MRYLDKLVDELAKGKGWIKCYVKNENAIKFYENMNIK
ncbi:hypothetical protein [Staphylococcus carnosus]